MSYVIIFTTNSTCGTLPTAVPVGNTTPHKHMLSLAMELLGYAGARQHCFSRSSQCATADRVLHALVQQLYWIDHCCVMPAPRETLLHFVLRCPAGYHHSIEPMCVVKSVSCITSTSTTQHCGCGN